MYICAININHLHYKLVEAEVIIFQSHHRRRLRQLAGKTIILEWLNVKTGRLHSRWNIQMTGLEKPHQECPKKSLGRHVMCCKNNYYVIVVQGHVMSYKERIYLLRCNFTEFGR